MKTIKKKKKSESLAAFMKRRQKETGMVKIKDTKPSPVDSGGSHTVKAKGLMQGFTKTSTIKKIEALAKKKKKAKIIEGKY